MILVIAYTSTSFEDVYNKVSDYLGVSYQESKKIVDNIRNKIKIVFTITGVYTRWFKLETDPLDLLYDIDEEGFKIARQGLFRTKGPVALALCPTYRCHLNCKYCYAPVRNRKFPDFRYELNYEEIIDAIDQLYKIGVKHVVITGGEPFLREDLPDIIRYISEKGIYVECSTKFPLTSDIIKKLKGCIDKLQISIDAYNPKTQDYLTGSPGSWNWLIENIDLGVENNIRMQVNIVMTGYNISEIPDLVMFLTDKGVDEICLSYYGKTFRHTDNKLFPTFSEYINLRREMYKRFEGKYNVIYEDLLILDTDKKPVILDLRGLKRVIEVLKGNISVLSDIVCGAFRYSMAILPDGSVTGCDRMAWIPDLVIGNIRNSRIQDLWYSKKAINLAFPSIEDFKGTPCYACESFEKCLAIGFCYVVNYQIYKNIFKPRLGCLNVKKKYKIV